MPNRSRPKSIRALDGRPGVAYDEETFLHLLGIEQARAERSNQRLRLLVATLEPVPGKPVPISNASAEKLFKGLRQLLRDTDIMGWYRQAQVVGAVLGAGVDAADSEASGLIQQRVGDGLRKRLPSKVAESLRVRVTYQGPRRVAQR